MDFISTRLPYRQTGEFEKLVLDYIDQSNSLSSFHSSPPSLQGVLKTIEKRKKSPVDRKTLVKHLKQQYETVQTSDRVRKNMDLLLSENTFTITTAHQNNLFTGPLYFIYKLIHVIKLADELTPVYPDLHFVPVFYMGTEDADLDELNHIWLHGEKLEWKPDQAGAVGRMKVDKLVKKLIDKIAGQISVLPWGEEILQKLKDCYKDGKTIQQATFEFVNLLFSEYGLVVLLPDASELKKLMLPVFEDEIFNQISGKIVNATVEKLETLGYKSQAHPREINLFYLKDGMRERIVQSGQEYKILNSEVTFSRSELQKELKAHPERFSPNVILRGLYQAIILPDIIFVGGGGELSYWLQFRDLFDHYKIPFPILVLRNSFLFVEKRWQQLISKLEFTSEDFFLSEQDLMNKLVLKQRGNSIRLNGGLSETEKLYESLKKQVAAVDSSLEKHVDALKVKTLNRLHQLEKKMLRAEKRKLTDHQNQIRSIKSNLFPGGVLQERRDNLLYYYAKWGKDFLQQVYQHSLGLEQEFLILQEK